MSTPVTPAPPYNPWVSVRKGLAGIFTVLLSVLPMFMDSLIVYFSTDANVSTAISLVAPSRVAYAPLISFLIRSLGNARKQAKAQ